MGKKNLDFADFRLTRLLDLWYKYNCEVSRYLRMVASQRITVPQFLGKSLMRDQVWDRVGVR